MFSRSDEALLARMLEGDLRAFDQLYGRYEKHLYGFLRRQLGSDAEAEEVMHEAFVALLRRRASGLEARSFRAWLFQVARNLGHNRLRERSRAAHALTELPARGADSTPEQALELQQSSQALKAAVSRLPSALGELYHLRSGGLSYEEVAEVLGVPLGTVKSRMHELVNRLRTELNP